VTDLTHIDATALADQINAARRDVTAAVAAHYTAMIETGMDPKAALNLTRDYQADLLTVHADAELVIHMEGGD
jgi:hypothetical protein